MGERAGAAADFEVRGDHSRDHRTVQHDRAPHPPRGRGRAQRPVRALPAARPVPQRRPAGGAGPGPLRAGRARRAAPGLRGDAARRQPEPVASPAGARPGGGGQPARPHRADPAGQRRLVAELLHRAAGLAAGMRSPGDPDALAGRPTTRCWSAPGPRRWDSCGRRRARCARTRPRSTCGCSTPISDPGSPRAQSARACPVTTWECPQLPGHLPESAHDCPVTTHGVPTTAGQRVGMRGIVGWWLAWVHASPRRPPAPPRRHSQHSQPPQRSRVSSVPTVRG